MSRTLQHLQLEQAESLVVMLGADFRTIIAPFQAELCETARAHHGDRHAAALHLLAQRQAMRRPLFEQQLILAALASGSDDVMAGSEAGRKSRATRTDRQLVGESR